MEYTPFGKEMPSFRTVFCTLLLRRRRWMGSSSKERSQRGIGRSKNFFFLKQKLAPFFYLKKIATEMGERPRTRAMVREMRKKDEEECQSRKLTSKDILHSMVCQRKKCTASCEKGKRIAEMIKTHVDKNFCSRPSIRCKATCSICKLHIALRYSILKHRQDPFPTQLTEWKDANGKLEDSPLICPVTCEVMDNPVRVRVCNHRFSESAIHAYMGSNDIFRCPVCREVFTRDHLEDDVETAKVLKELN